MSQPPPRRRTAHNLMLFMWSNWMRTVLLVAVGFVLTPMLIQSFGFVLFGLFILIQQFSNAMVTPFRAAVTAILVKSISEARGSGDDEDVSRVFTNGVCVLASLPVIIITLAVIGIIFVSNILDFPPEQLFNIRLAIAAEASIITVIVLTAPYLSIYLINQRPVLYNADLTVRRWLDLIAFLLALLPVGWNVFAAFILIRLVLNSMHGSVRVLIARQVMPEARIRLSLLNRATMGKLIRLGGLTAGQPFSNFNFFVLDNYLLNFVFGPIYNGIYAIVTQLRGYARRFGSQVFVGTVAIASDIHERGEHRTNIKAMLAVSRITAGVMMLSTGIIVIFFQPLIDLWLGSRLRADPSLAEVMPYEEAVDLVWGILTLLLVGGIMLETATGASKFLYGMGLVKRYAGVMFGAGIAKFIISVIIAVIMVRAVTDISAHPAASLLFPAVTLLCQVIFFGILMPHRVIKLTQISVGTWCWHALAKPLMASVIPLGVGVVLIVTIQEWNWPWLVSSILLIGLLCMPSSFFLLLEGSERQRVWNVIGRVRTGRLKGKGQSC
ncbi:MAG: hypothetical protein VX527_07675 [Planctomycetota bacterium]|nr:hypothetical protein [Planctomycetota bacterium]